VSTPRTAAFAVLGAAALFGTSATSVQLLIPDAPPASVAAMRLAVGSLGLVAVVIWRFGGQTLLDLWRRPVVWLMGLSVAGYQALFFIGTSRTGVALGTLVALGLAPLVAGLLGWILREGAPGWLWVLSTILAIVGLAMLTAGAADTRDAWGILAALGSGACYALYTVLGVRITRAGVPASATLAAGFSVGAVLLLPAIIGTSWWFTTAGLVEILWLGLVTTTAAYLLFGVGLRVLQPGHIATLTLLEPAVATILAVVVLSEPLGALGWTGCLVILGALALLGVGEGRRAGSAA
jgi:DME family drug/metabolite transporter